MKAQRALDLLLPIPASQFITNEFTDHVGKCCAIGHIVRLTSKDPTDYSESNCSDDHQSSIRKTSDRFLREHYDIEEKNIAFVNNDDDINGYNEPIIKDRVIHLLKDMVEAGY